MVSRAPVTSVLQYSLIRKLLLNLKGRTIERPSLPMKTMATGKLVCVYISTWLIRVFGDVITNGPNQITITNGEGVIVPKPEARWNDNDKKLWSHD